MAKLGRNDPCHCGSGKKYKKCCLAKDEAEEAQARALATPAYDLNRSPGVPVAEAPELDLLGFEDFLDRFGSSLRRQRRTAITLPAAPLDQPPTAADLGPEVERDHIGEAIEQLTLDWVGTVHQRDGVPLERLGMARDVLEEYLLDRSQEGAAGATLLIPWPNQLDETLWSEIRTSPREVAAFLELLPIYIDYLVERGFIDRETGSSILPDLWYVRLVMLDHLREKLEDTEAVEAVERADWPEPVREPRAPIRPDLAALLEQLMCTGQEPQRELLERVRAYGSEAVPALVDLATDNRLLFAEEDEPKWAPNHAVRLLGEMRAEEAIAPLLPLFMIPGDYHIAGDLQRAFGSIGPAALPSLRKLFTDRTHDIYLRARAAEAMAEVVRHYPETREEVIAVEQSELDSGTNPTANAFIIADLLHLRAAEALPSIERAYAEDRVELGVVGGLDDVKQEIHAPFEPVEDARLTPQSIGQA